MNRKPILTNNLEMWGGVECTVNRVGDLYFDQLNRSGHATRNEDINLFAGLGIRAMRLPVLWERTAPESLNKPDWVWADERLERLRELAIRPIVGLIHHGSGPRYTSLIDQGFATGLANYARLVAERYPWVNYYTPVNEPLTTARFSCLYGYWYPHGRGGLTFARALLMQCRAITLSMRAIREVNPDARLVQTEDLGKTTSTQLLAYQAEFENERRWLTFDLLCGLVGDSHPMWHYFEWLGVGRAEMEWFLDNPCPPDIIGINHYLTSERFLDERLERYPASSHGGNERHRYADVETVRVCAEGTFGPQALMEEAWERYRLPIAITEAHIGCTREEQLRWLKEIWDSARTLRQQGVDVRAVTAWALLGAFDWNNLLTGCGSHYESGVFDLRSPRPRPTALARMIRELAEGREHNHPVLDIRGWWRRDRRLIYPPVNRACEKALLWSKEITLKRKPSTMESSPRMILITGATGTLGSAFARICHMRGLAHRVTSRKEMDIADSDSVNAVLKLYKPWAVVNAAGYVRVDDAERDAQTCMRENADGPAVLAAVSARFGIKLLTFSSDLVFDGADATPYLESAIVSPLGVYGRSKAAAENRVLDCLASSLVIRTSAFFGPWDDYNFVATVLRTLLMGKTFVAADDQVVSPTYVPDLVNASLDLLIDDECGVWHLANTGAITWADLARQVANFVNVDINRIDARPARTSELIAPRPRYSVLGSERGTLMPSLEDALARYFDDKLSFIEKAFQVASNNS